MSEPKFKIGQPVYFRPAKPLNGERIEHRYHVLSRLPPIGGEYQYRIRNGQTEQEWTASERELRPANPLGTRRNTHGE